MDYWKIRATKYNGLAWVNNASAIERLIDFARLGERMTVLDAGCGTGVLTRLIAPKVLRVVAADSSPQMLCKVEKRSNVEIIKIDFTDDEFVRSRQESFDRIIARMVFHHLEDHAYAFNQCQRLLRPGGMLVIEEGGVYEPENVHNWSASRAWY